MQIDTEELGALAEMLSARRTEELEAALEEQRRQAEYWRARCEAAEQAAAEQAVHNVLLTNYIVLSIEKIRAFVAKLCKVEQWALLHTFMQWALPDELTARELPMLEEMMPMPDEGRPATNAYNNFAAGCECKVFNGNSEVQINK